jgi:hypothetical protein
MFLLLLGEGMEPVNNGVAFCFYAPLCNRPIITFRVTCGNSIPTLYVCESLCLKFERGVLNYVWYLWSDQPGWRT